ncbi:hypothetical protein [Nocardia salmonicida]|uniref:hypothetical protein n=1 Tax=Nocardia salmonicida TaxID=53431 RepID=UPI0033FF25AB
MIDDLSAQARTDEFENRHSHPRRPRPGKRRTHPVPSLNLDLSDAVCVALAGEYETATILTLDHRDFRALTPLTEQRSFRLLPADL